MRTACRGSGARSGFGKLPVACSSTTSVRIGSSRAASRFMARSSSRASRARGRARGRPGSARGLRRRRLASASTTSAMRDQPSTAGGTPAARLTSTSPSAASASAVSAITTAGGAGAGASSGAPARRCGTKLRSEKVHSIWSKASSSPPGSNCTRTRCRLSQAFSTRRQAKRRRAADVAAREHVEVDLRRRHRPQPPCNSQSTSSGTGRPVLPLWLPVR